MVERLDSAGVAPWARVVILVAALIAACAISFYSTGTVHPHIVA
jgi:hypothetical protein